MKLLTSNYKLAYKFYITVRRFHARIQSSICTTYGKCLRESIMAVLTRKSGIVCWWVFRFIPAVLVKNESESLDQLKLILDPAANYMFEVNNGNTRKRCEIYSKLITKTPERRQWPRSGVFIVNFEHISRLVLVFLLLILSK